MRTSEQTSGFDLDPLPRVVGVSHFAMLFAYLATVLATYVTGSTSAERIFSNATFDVRNTTGLVYAQGLTCSNSCEGTAPQKGCVPMNLTFDL